MTVYVRWYGKVLEGELLEGDHLGMKQVRIPLDGHHPIALFTHEHVYETAEQISEKPSEISEKLSDALPADDRQSIEAFKEANWDHSRNHLRIDKLDEFYQLWRMYMVPFGYVEAEAPAERKEEKTNRQCEKCDCWEHTTTLGSPDQPVWHCRHGFLPSKDCQDMAAYNESCMAADPNQRPANYKPVSPKLDKPVQLSLFD